MPVARKTDPLTSHEAAASVLEHTISETKRMILEHLTQEPATDVAIFLAWPEEEVSSSGLRTRRKELVDEGLVIDTGRREQLASGRWATVWGLPGSKPTCRHPSGPEGEWSCGLDLKNPISSETMLEGRCPVHGWQTIAL
jgi:hypothetical protein